MTYDIERDIAGLEKARERDEDAMIDAIADDDDDTFGEGDPDEYDEE
jgi:hypothetical protein